LARWPDIPADLYDDGDNDDDNAPVQVLATVIKTNEAP